MKFLLIQPPIDDFYTTPIRFYPLGLLYVARVLEMFGHQVQVFDCLTPLKKKILPLPDEFGSLRHAVREHPYFFKHFYHFGADDEKILHHIEIAAPDYIGISANFTAYYQAVAHLANQIKKHFPIPIFIGGHHASMFAAEIKRRTPAIDAILPGPAEQALPPFLHHLSEGQASPEALDWRTLRPAHHLLDGDAYQIGRKNYISLTASRGCPYFCDFCSIHRMFGRKISYRPVMEVIKEMVVNFNEKGTRIFNFEDDNLTHNRKWWQHFLRSVIDTRSLKGIELTAMNGLCYPTLSEETLDLMKEAGFKRLDLSYVSGDFRLRTRHRRPPDRESLEKIIRIGHDLDYFITVYLIIGFPGQRYEQVKQTIEYLLNLGVLVGPSVFYLPPGSSLYERLSIPSSLKNNWNAYRSSAFAIEGKHLTREQLIELFCYVRERNLKVREGR